MEGVATMTAREQFLARVRDAVVEGARAGQPRQVATRGAVAYQGAGPDPVQRFCEELKAAGGNPHCVASREHALQSVIDLVDRFGAKKILLGSGPAVNDLGLGELLRAPDKSILSAHDLDANGSKEALFSADLGITGARTLIAETGTVVLFSGPGEPRSFSLLPPVHIVVAYRSQIIPDLFDLFGSSLQGSEPSLPSCLSLITGPSKTGDIELRLVTGVHGPGELHVVLM
jgi:L-lactate dehydrogenase complex protein LldG